MSWEDLHARTEVIHAVLERAAQDPSDPNIFNIPDLERLFGGPDGVLLALQYRWRIHLEAKTDQAISDGRTPDDAAIELMAEQPTLYAVLSAQLRCGGPGRPRQRLHARSINSVENGLTDFNQSENWVHGGPDTPFAIAQAYTI
ncbi:hypothetical protein [Nocardia wallacei]|uniref:hypothetical protein n=1 Tax=Nocardia wallacei TaxID=480035 RepID=UPI00245860F5|nr:hypothetical protein [Nocardia wallacei]